MKNRPATRRVFLKRAGAALGTAGLAPSLTAAAGANDRIVLGIIGTGGRGTWLLEEAQKLGCAVAALCDVSEMRLRWAASRVQGVPAEHEDFERLLEHKDMDAVVNATPDHWHHDILLAAVAAGKDVYTEKPFSRTIEEGAAMVKAVRGTTRIVQVGTHRRSGAHWHRARDVIAAGQLGRITWARVFDARSWIGNDPFADRGVEGKLNWDRFLGRAPKRPFEPYRYFAWRWFWDYSGGLVTDLGSHQFDILQWLTDSMGPRSVAANGGVYFFTQWETPDIVHAVLDYGTFAGVFSAGFTNAYEGVGARFYGTEATLIVTDTEFHVAREGGAGTEGEPWPRAYEGQAHLGNWLDCIRARREPSCPVELGNQAVNVAHAVNRAFREGRTVRWDPKAQAEIKD